MESIPSTPATNATPPQDDVQKNKLLAAISYLYLVSLIILLVKKDSPFAQFHAKQGFILFIASLVAGFIPVFGILLHLVVFALMIAGLIMALQGKWFKMPLISQLAEKINF